MTENRLTATMQPIFSPRPAPVLTRPIPKITPPTAPVNIPEPPDVAQVISLGRLMQGGRWRTEAMRSYSRPTLYWFTRGQGRATISGTTRGFAPHTAFLLPPGVMHGFDLIGQVSGALVFLPRSLAKLWPERSMRLGLRDGQSQMELTAKIDALRCEAEGALEHREAALDHLASLLAIWLKRMPCERADMAPSTYADLAAAFAALVETDFARGLTVADYAARLGVTPTHLSRVCRATCGRPAHDVLSSRRLFHAQSLLADTETPVATIAVTSGFGSAAYFSRAFRLATGRSPTAFRRDALQGRPFATPEMSLF